MPTSFRMFVRLQATCAAGLWLAGALLLGTAYGASPQDAVGSVHFYGVAENSAECPLPGSADGTTVFSPPCDHARESFLVDKLASGGTLLISAGDCSETTTAQDWWVKLQATSRLTSTPRLQVNAVVSEAKKWIDNGKKDVSYVAPYLKIVAAGVKNVGSSNVRCAMLSHPYTNPAKTVVLSLQPWGAFTENQDAQCSQGPLTTLYSDGYNKFGYQCGELRDGFGNLYVPSDRVTVSFKINEAPAYCPAGKVATGLYRKGWGGTLIEGHLTCATFKQKETGAALQVSTARQTNRRVNVKGHYSLCEMPGHQGAVNLLSSPNTFLVGFDMKVSDTSLYCAPVSTGL